MKSQAWYDAMHARKGHGSNQYTKAKELGLPQPRLSDDTRKKLAKFGDANPSSRQDVREKISRTCLEKSRNGEWHTSVAKKMHYSYKGFDFDGTWELAYARYLDTLGVQWERCKHRFAYTFEGKLRYYTPDFYLPGTQEYVEIKGYETDKDRAKWSQFPAKLIILKKEDLNELGLDVK